MRKIESVPLKFRAPSRAKVTEIPGGSRAFRHNDPSVPVVYGSWFGWRRAPGVFLEAGSGDLMDYLRGDPAGPFAGRVDAWAWGAGGEAAQRWRQWGFAEDKKEAILKSDWHCLPNMGRTVERFVPRLGKPGTLRRAPPRCLAFFDAFRLVNGRCWQTMIRSLTRLKAARERGTDEEWRIRDGSGLVDSLVHSLRAHEHFGALEVQVWWGDRHLTLPSHKDGATSLLHLGLTLGGRRTLRRCVYRTCGADGAGPPRRSDGNLDSDASAKERNATEADVWGDGKRVLHVAGSNAGVLEEVGMTPGAAYISSPYCFEHGVRFEQGSRDQPLITMQCRFAFDPDVGKRMNHMRDAAMRDVICAVVDTLCTSIDDGSLRMPSLSEVKAAESRVPLVWGVHMEG